MSLFVIKNERQRNTLIFSKTKNGFFKENENFPFLMT